MKKGQKRKQAKALKKRAQRKVGRKRGRVPSFGGRPRHIRQARDYPFDGCWVLRDWQETGISPVLVARRQPDGNIVFGNYLVDFFCLGVKDAFARDNIPRRQFRREIVPEMFRGNQRSISVALAHEMVYGSIEFAAQYGFKPHPDFRRAQYVLDPPDMHPRTGQVEFGKDGKPLYVAGPYDDTEAILRNLQRTAGEDNISYLVELDPDFLDDDLFE